MCTVNPAGVVDVLDGDDVDGHRHQHRLGLPPEEGLARMIAPAMMVGSHGWSWQDGCASTSMAVSEFGSG